MEKALKAGCDGFIPKPARSSLLYHEILKFSYDEPIP